jgi:hypothetical protein
LERDSLEYFGACNIEEMTHLAAIWHDDSKNLNGRWKEIEDFYSMKGLQVTKIGILHYRQAP